MTAEQFKIFWASTYPGLIPISHCLRENNSNRWFRIHSLPGSKRYAENADEWEILLYRQNKIITDLLGDYSKIILVTGAYDFESAIELHPLTAPTVISDMPFIQLDYIDLYLHNPEQYDKGAVYKPLFWEQIWHKNKFDNLLKEIAGDELRAFFISEKNNCIVAPYDGGIDFIVKDRATSDFYKQEYKDWLSAREDGL
jgi:hypothetical protein